MARWPGARRYHWCDLGLDRTGCYSARQGCPANSKAIDGTRFQESKHLAHCFRSPRFLGAIFSSSTFLEAYTKDVFGISPYISGLMASTIMFASIFGGPSGGYLSDRLRRRKIFILVPGMLGSLGIILFGVSQPLELWFLIPLVGFM